MGIRTGKPTGRPKGVKNRATIEREVRAAQGVKAAVEGGDLPLDVMLKRMRGDSEITDNQFQAAIAAAPYVHPRLAAVESKVTAEVAMSAPVDAPPQETRDEWLARRRREVHAAALMGAAAGSAD